MIEDAGHEMVPPRPVRAWVLGDAMRYIRERKTGARQHHYDLSLSGGILDVAFSDNNVDIVATPVEDHEVTWDDYLDFSTWLKQNNFLEVEHARYNNIMRRHTFQDDQGRQVDFYVITPPPI